MSLSAPLCKARGLLELRRAIGNCQLCSLAGARTNIVFGEGHLSSQVLFVGEAPGQTEDEQGRPFVGRSGNLLDQAFQAAGWSREQVYITNVVMCRPPNNREPSVAEKEACHRFLLAKIDVLNPKLLVALGRTAAEFLLQRPVKITKERGQTFPLAWRSNVETKVMPIFHPSYVLRNQSKEVVDAFYGDIRKAKEYQL